MILKLLKNGEYKKGEPQTNQYEYYYYDYIPEENAIVIRFETTPENHSDRFDINVHKDEFMYDDLRRKLLSLGFSRDALQFDNNKSSVVIKKSAFLDMLVKRVSENRSNSEGFNDAIATVDLLESLNLKIHADFLPQINEIIEGKHKFFGIREEEANNIKLYSFYVKNNVSIRLKNISLGLLTHKIMRLTSELSGSDENVKFIDDQAGLRVTIKKCVYDKLKILYEELLKSSVDNKHRFNEQEHFIEKASRAANILNFDKLSIKYEGKKDYLKLIVDTFKDMNNLDEVIQLYKIVKENHDKVDIHKHWFFDKIFGKKYTTSWQNAMKEIREHALLLLNKKLVACNDDTEAKKKMIEDYNKSPIFTDHRSNNPFRFFYKPNTLKRLDLTLEKYTQQIQNAVKIIR